MSHGKERVQKNCLNCNTLVQGRFCQACGQENVETKQGFWQMVQHFVFDIFHFDGKFFETFRLLITKPGSVAKEYANGRKAAYLDPVRMYLFISTVIFFLLPLFTSIQQTISNIHIVASPSERLREASKSYALYKTNPAQEEASKKLDVLLDTTLHLQLKTKDEIGDTTNAIDFWVQGTPYKATPVKEEALFPTGNWLQNRVANKVKAQFEEQGKDFNQLMLEQAQSQQKTMPYILFLSLPLFTMMLTLLYRKKTGLYYSDHAAFTLYHYILVFGLLGIALILQLLLKLFGVSSSFIFLPILSITLLHLLFEMKVFYAQSWGKTVLKFLLLSLSVIIMIAALFLLISLLLLII
ncbi:MAG TPA: DUF3667 domain-containing protein [Flavisolibacter sp.]|nr:DUF3667 domain-containing protein [Flavisolibacter sp.]